MPTTHLVFHWLAGIGAMVKAVATTVIISMALRYQHRAADSTARSA